VHFVLQAVGGPGPPVRFILLTIGFRCAESVGPFREALRLTVDVLAPRLSGTALDLTQTDRCWGRRTTGRRRCGY
jgi:hypothetical protein